jgi:hypothetical protein
MFLFKYTVYLLKEPQEAVAIGLTVSTLLSDNQFL